MKLASGILRSLRVSPLAACIAIACVGNAVASDGSTTSSARLPFTGSLVASTVPVTSCADDGSPGTLRSLLLTASDSDTLDLSGLNCVDSKITLTQGQLVVRTPYLRLQGPTPIPSGPALTIDAGGTSRALYVTGFRVELDSLGIANGNVTVTDDTAKGGCILATSDLTISNSSVHDCSATAAYAFGGGIYSYGRVSLFNSSVTGSSATSEATPTLSLYAAAVGGGIASRYVYTSNSVISGNKATLSANLSSSQLLNSRAFGGGIAIIGDSTSAGSNLIMSSSISGNMVKGSPGLGGGIFAVEYGSSQYLYVISSTLSNNTAYRGGAITLKNNVITGEIFNSTIAGNYGYSAGGIDADAAQALTIANSTIAFNRSAYSTAGVIAPSTMTFTMQSSILANNTTYEPTTHGMDLGVTFSTAFVVAGKNNLVMSHDSNIGFANTPMTSDPLLMPLANYGGNIQTLALSDGSPAINAGNDIQGFPYDERGPGFPRVYGGRADIGAYENNGVLDRIFADGFE